MRSITYSIIISLTIISLGFAQDSPQWQLPDGAKMRFGKGSIYDMAYSPDGTKLAVATGIGIWIYDTHTWEEHNLLTDGNTRIRELDYSPNGKHLVSDIDEKSLCIWDADTGKQLHKFYEHNQAYISDVAFSPDGKTFASADSRGGVQVWDAETRQQLHAYNIHTNSVFTIDFSPDGNLLASSSTDTTIQLYDPHTGNHLRSLSGHTSGVPSIAFSPDGKTIASASYDRSFRLWDVETAVTHQDGTDHEAHLIQKHPSSVYALAYSPDGKYFATANRDMTTRLYDVATLNLQRLINNDPNYMWNLTFSPDSLTLLSHGLEGRIHVWDVVSGSKEHIITGHNYLATRSVAISPDGDTLVTNDVNRSLTLWDLNSGNRLHNFTGHTDLINTVAFSPVNNNLFASGSNDGTLRLWDADTGTERATLITVDGDVESVAFSPDGSTVACAITYGAYQSQDFKRDSTIRQFDVATGAELKAIFAHIAQPNADKPLEFHPTRHVSPVYSIRYSHDGKMLVSYSQTWFSSNSDRTIRFWDAETGQHLRFLQRQLGQIQVNSISFTPDGKILATGTDYDIHGEDLDIMELWDITDDTPKLLLSNYVEGIYSVRLNPSGTTLVSINRDGIIRLLDVKTGRLLSTYSVIGTGSPVFDSKGTTLATGTSWGAIFVWDITVRLPSDTAVGLSPDTLVSPLKGGYLTLSLNIANGQNVAGYQATVNYDGTALRYVDSAKGDYLSPTAYVIDPIVSEGTTSESHPSSSVGATSRSRSSVTLGATSFAEVAYDDGTLATITFEVITVNDSAITLSDVILTDLYGNSTTPQIVASTQITAPALAPADVNRDGVVDILDLNYVASNIGKIGRHEADINNDGVVNIVDLALVAAAIGSADAAAPTLWDRDLPTRATVEAWLQEARELNLPDPAFQRGILVLEQLLRNLTPKETALLPNYPNPFNPETWLPYQLSSPSDVRIDIYTSDGKLIRTLDLGHQAVGIYQHRTQAAHWDGRNKTDEPVASGIYFYTLTAGTFTATRKMLIQK
ncbi:T9SS type A sorting domain-containing protein [Candidatus Poribacteria bacterium]|nr:T9SS type A sorting domain-containing protein [Candidatus Poribacteria bacterium]